MTQVGFSELDPQLRETSFATQVASASSERVRPAGGPDGADAAPGHRRAESALPRGGDL